MTAVVFEQKDKTHYWLYVASLVIIAVYSHFPVTVMHRLGLGPSEKLGILLFAILTVFPWYLYYQWLVGRREVPFPWWQATLILGLVALATNPIFLSNDIMEYMAQSRGHIVFGLNPYETSLSAIPDYQDDPILSRAFWVNWRGVYGPVWYWFLGLITRVTQSPWAYSLILRGFALAAHLANSQLIYLLARAWGLPDDARFSPGKARLLYAVNAIPLVEHVASGHNDVFMLTLVLAALYATFSTRPARRVGGYVSYGLGLALKSVAAIWGPLLILQSTRRSGKKLEPLRGVLVAAVTLVIAYMRYWNGVGALTRLSEQAQLFSRLSLVFVVKRVVGLVNTELALGVTAFLLGPLGKGLLAALFLAGYLLVIRCSVKRGFLPMDYIHVTVLFLVLVVTWNQPWYVTWILPMIFLSERPLCWTPLFFVWGFLHVLA